MPRLGDQTVELKNPVTIISAASVAGTKEGEGPLREYFDVILDHDLYGETSWERAESKMIKEGLTIAVKKSGLDMKDINYIISGDLLNQGVGTTFGILEMDRPFFGVYGACSTMSESMSIGAMLIDGGFAEYILAGASSHFCAAEKQFRFPLELGNQRPPTTTWTVTGEGAVVLSNKGFGPKITQITTGKIVDLNITDPNNMGAAMVPSAVSTMIAHFKDSGRSPDYYDLIVTGDLGELGMALTIELCREKGYNISENYSDCGVLIYDNKKQNTNCGGSGCACSALTFSGYLYKKMIKKEINKLLFIPTGALLSRLSTLQGESIPGIAHAIAIENV